MDALILADGNFRLCNEDSLADSAVFLCAGDQLNGRTVNDDDFLLTDDRIQFAGNNHVDGILEENIFAVEFLDHLARYLALTEALHGNILLLTLINALAGFFKILSRNGECNFSHVHICFDIRY